MLTVDGKRVPLEQRGATVTNPPGQGGLKTTRTVIELRADVSGERGSRSPTTRSRAASAGRRSCTDPSQDPTNGPHDLPQRRAAEPVRHPRSPPSRRTTASPASCDGDRLLIVLLLAAFGWGAVHALSPGHGKAMVAAYLVGTRGRPRDAVALGGIVTVTHTAGVFALGFDHARALAVRPARGPLPVPEPGLRAARDRASALDRACAAQLRTRHAPPTITTTTTTTTTAPDRKSLLGMGAAAGLIPCPSALVVLLGAISQDQIALGMLLIVAFSLGLAATLTALGLAVVQARRLPLPGPVIPALPMASAIAIVAVGCVLTAHAIPTLLGPRGPHAHP